MDEAKSQTAKFCTRRIVSTLMITQNATRARPRRQPPKPTTPAPGMCTGSSSQPMKTRAVRALSPASRASVTRCPAEATGRKLTRGSAEKSSSPARSEHWA